MDDNLKQEVKLDQELIDDFGNEIELAIEKVINKKDSDFVLELLVVLMEMAVQAASAMKMCPEDFKEFSEQFLSSLQNDSSGVEIFNINTKVKNNGKPN